MAEREAEVQARLGCHVELVVRHVVAEHVAAVVGEPQLVCHRVPGEADTVPDAFGEDLEPGTVRLHPQDRGRQRRRGMQVAQTLHVEPIDMYSMSSGPKAMNFQV